MNTKKTRTILISLIVIAILAVLLAVGFKIISNNNNSVAGNNTGQTDAQTSNESASSTESSDNSTTSSSEAPNNFSSDAGILLSKDGINKPISVIPTVEVYAAPICPFCGAIERASGGTLERMAKEGKINLISHPLALNWMNRFTPNDNYSQRAAAALVFVGAKDPEHYFDFLSYIFRADIQPQEGYEYKAVSNETIQTWAKNAGVSDEVSKNCTSEEYLKWISSWSDGAGITSTPIVKVNEKEVKYNAILGDSQMSQDLRTVTKEASEASIQKILDNPAEYQKSNKD